MTLSARRNCRYQTGARGHRLGDAGSHGPGKIDWLSHCELKRAANATKFQFPSLARRPCIINKKCPRVVNTERLLLGLR